MRRLVTLALVCAACVAAPATAAPREVPRATPRGEADGSMVTPEGVDDALWLRARRAYDKARAAGHARRARLVVIDYTRPSTEERLWVVDMETNRVLFRELVAHGKHTGEDAARAFSNVPGSLKSSVGVFVTDDIYIGQHGKSLRLDGLEPGFNDNARERAIVIHGAAYVDAALARKQGRLGRSFGCPALRDEIAGEVIDAVAGGAVVFAWGADAAWQKRSSYLR